MYADFSRAFALDSSDGSERDRWDAPLLVQATGYDELAAQFAGRSFDGGLYRIHDAKSGALAQRLLSETFSAYAPTTTAFAFDWLGNQYALDNARREGNEPLVKIFEIATGNVYDVPDALVAFHDELLAGDKETLAEGFFGQWRDAARFAGPLKFSDCVGYDVPLFLGGSDDLSNLAVTNLDVYWTITGQLRAQTDDLPPGTPISGVSTN